MDALAVARAASEAFRLIDPNIGAQTITVLLTVAQNDGRLMVSDLERLCAITRESASRNLTLLSSRKMKDGRHGYGLVEHRESDTDRRVKNLYLTRTGQQMIDKILAAIQAAGGGKK